jgi:hypothetical protein
MTRKYEKEYRRFIMGVSAWLKKTMDRIEMLPEMERLNQLSYEQWCELFKEDNQLKKVASPPSPPPARLLKEGAKPPPPPPTPEEHSCKKCKELGRGYPPDDDYFCNKKHVGGNIYKTNDCQDFNPK